MFPNCSSCGLVIKYEDDARCSKCIRIYHAACASSRQECGNASSTAWICDACTITVQRSSGPESSAQPPEASLEHGLGASEPLNISHFKSIMDQFTSLNAAINDCRSGIHNTNKLLAEHGELISSCIGEIGDLKQENTELRLKVADMERRLQAVNIDALYTETRDRLQRESNIMIFNVPERDQSHLDDDASVVKNVLSSIAEVSADDIQSVSRVGNRRPESSRPIKVQLKDPRAKFLILKQKNRLRNTSFHNVSVNSDMTPKQQEHLRNLRRDLARRKALGEKDIAIRFVHNEAVIVKLSTSQSPTAASLSVNDPALHNKRSREESASPRGPSEIKCPNTPSASRRPSK